MSSPTLDGFVRKMVGILLSKTVSQYLKDVEHRHEFEEWYFQKYGTKYQWKTKSVQHDNRSPQ